MAFNKAKESLKKANILAHLDPSMVLRLQRDYSSYGVGAVLFRITGNVQRPIGFRSRTLTKEERNYSQLEREAPAPVFGVTKFRDYLLVQEFTLVIDRQSLVGLLDRTATRHQWLPLGFSAGLSTRVATTTVPVRTFARDSK